ncbi:MAG: hypothetical protein JNK93_06095, partial [Planctomycetia bacterium]|nr:hypothetical protein [Planctomycetia bacterium]
MAKSSNEAKLPVIIALVFFILATLGVGIFAYTLTEDVTAAKENEKKATDETAAAKKAQAAAREELLLYKTVLGNLDANERATVQSGLTDAAGFRDKHAKLMQDLTGRVDAAKRNEVNRAPGIGGGGLNLADAVVYKWDWPANQQHPPLPAESIIDASVRNVAQRELAKRKSDAEIKVMQDSVKSLNDVITQFNDAKAKLEALNKQYPEDVKAEVSKAIAQFDGFKTQFQNVSGQYRKDTDKLNEDLVAREVTIKRSQADNDRYKAAVDKLNEQLDA